jgi:hypothetical protein
MLKALLVSLAPVLAKFILDEFSKELDLCRKRRKF